MKLGELWSDMEGRAPSERVGRLIQRIYPEAGIDLFATLELEGAERARPALELQVSADALVDLDVTGTKRVTLTTDDRGEGRAALVLGLEDLGARDLFAALCTDVAAATALRTGDEDAVAAWVGRFAKWRRMLQGGPEGLRPRRQRGLYAELKTLTEHLIPNVGFDEAVLAWKGPDGAPRDLEIGGCGIEVKSSAANEPQIVPVHGERQLDDAGLETLVLIHVSLEVLRDTGETLPTIVGRIRDLGEGRAEAGTLDDRLIQSGYADVHASLYRRTGYALRRTSFFHVRPGFPRVTEADLVDGVGGVRYSLAIAACSDFEVSERFLQKHLGATAV